MYGPQELRALFGPRPVRGPLLRMALAENAALTAAENASYRAAKSRLRALAGRRCPLCGPGLHWLGFDGLTLHCEAGHGWTNPDVAEQEMPNEE